MSDGCFYCDGYTDYHPECDHPSCDRQTHGYGPDGKRVNAHCEKHRQEEVKA